MAARQRQTNSTELTAPLSDPVTAYAKDVTSGRTVAGPMVRAACSRHLQDLKEGKRRGLVWDLDAVHRVFRYFSTMLRLSGGEFEDKAFDLQPWQAFIVGSIFGWKVKATGARRFKTAYIEIGKGNGKSPLAAGIGLYCLHADINPRTGEKEARSEVYAAATKKDQAMVLFRDAVAMVKLSPKLRNLIGWSGSEGKEWNLDYLPTGSFFRPISSEDGQSGPRPHCGICDEVHEHKDRNVIRMMRAGARKGRVQPLIVEITNSGFDRTSICWEHHEKSRKVVEGLLQDDEWFSYVCGLDAEDIEGDAWMDRPECWIKANPNLGVSIQAAALQSAIAEARGMPSERGIVARLHLCVWTDAASSWIDSALWRATLRKDVDEAALKGRPCYLGLDLSRSTDLTALVAVWVLEDGSLFAKSWFFTPKDTLKKRADIDNVPYELWADDGHIEAVPGRIIDKAYVARTVQQLVAEHDVRALAYDQAMIDDFLRACDDIGLDAWIYRGPEGEVGDGLMLVRHGQGFLGWNSQEVLFMPRSVEALKRAVVKAEIAILENPCLTWNSASAVLMSNEAGSEKWNKRKRTGRIDGMVALTMAVGVARLPPEGPKPKQKLTAAQLFGGFA